MARDGIVAHDLTRSTILRPPPQFGVGGAFEDAGVPQIGAIAGPTYLVTVSRNGEMDKLDASLAARQIAWLADLGKQIDGLDAAELRGSSRRKSGSSTESNGDGCQDRGERRRRERK